MLTVEHVRARRTGGELKLLRLDEHGRARAEGIARAYVSLARDHVDKTRRALDSALQSVDVLAKDRKLGAGLRKLVDDRCDFEADSDDAPSLRAELFATATRVRRAATDQRPFDRQAVLSGFARARGTTVERVERGLYADLRAEHVLRSFQVETADRLVDEWQRGQAQAVLLRATRVVATVRCASPDMYRALFRKLRFRRLLHRAERMVDGAYCIEIDGPMSLFSSATKYGLALALVLPAIQSADRWTIEAELLWGKNREPLRFRLSGESDSARSLDDALPEESQRLLERFNALGGPWDAAPADVILELPGLGVCVPDLRFEHRDSGRVVHLEVMGYWSREAVWRRVELVQAGLEERIVFAVSRRLRVSDTVLSDDLPGALYVYKGTMSARALAERLDTVAKRA